MNKNMPTYDFPRGAASILIKKSMLTPEQIQAIIYHVAYAHAHFAHDGLIYRWWDTVDDFEIDAWRVYNNFGRIFLWTAYDNFNMGRFLVKLLGQELANAVWLDSWHGCYQANQTDLYFEAARLAACV
jgi:hypothetical protein